MKNFTFKFLSLVLCLWCFAPTGSLNAQDCTAATAVTTTGCAPTTTTDPGLTGTASNVCFGSGATLANWYSYVAPANGTITIASVSNGDSDDTRLSLYDDCPVTNCIASDDDGGPGFFSTITDAPVTSGTTYYIEWDDRWNPGGFDWDISFACAAPPVATGMGGAVTGTIEVTYDASVTSIEYGPTGFAAGTGTTVAATGSPQTIVDAVVFTDCGSVDVYVTSDCVGDPACAGTSTVAAINTFCPCGDPTGITATDVTTCGGAATVDVAWTSGMAPDNYDIEFGATGFAPGTGAEAASATATGATMITVTTGLANGATYDVYVRHDCGTGFSAWNGPVSVSVGGVVGGSCDCSTEIVTTGCASTTTTDPGLAGTASNVCFGSGATLANWYNYTPPANGTLTISALSNGGSDDTRLSLYDDCPVTNCVASDDDGGPGFFSAITDAPVTGGTVYHIEFDDRWNAGGFDFNVTFNCATPADPTGMAGTASGQIEVSYGSDVTALEIGPVGFTPGTGTLVPATGSPQTINGGAAIPDCSTVDVIAINDCLGDPTCAVNSGAVAVNTFCPCGDPGNVAAADASMCNAPQVDVTWDTGMTPDNYEVEIGAPGFAPGTGAEVAAATVTGGLMNSFTAADGIAVGSDYEVYVRHDCGTGFSAWNGPAAVSTTGVQGSSCDCPDAATATEDCVANTFTAADANAGPASNVCFGSGATNARWYEYTPTANGVVTIASLSNGDSDDTRLSVYDDCVGGVVSNCVASDDDGGPGFFSMVSDLAVTGGTTYYIEWDDRWNAGSFDWTITWCLPNDDCAGAIDLNGGAADGIPGGVTGNTTVGASASGDVNGCGGDPDDDVWFEFTTDADGGDVTVSITNTAAGFVPVCEVFSGTCGALVSEGCGAATTMLTGLPAGTQYFVRVFDNGTGFTGGAQERAAGTFDIAVAGSALPAELISFTGKAMEKYNALNWETASESNVSEFAVERSSNGRDNWEVIGTKRATGNSDINVGYSFDDMRPTSQAYYRLNTVDLDGSSQTSNIVSIKRDARGFDVVLVAPNPTTTKTTVTFESLDNAQVNATITDITGKVISTLTQDAISGLNNMTIDLSNVPSGVYFLTMNNGVNNITRRIVKN